MFKKVVDFIVNAKEVYMCQRAVKAYMERMHCLDLYGYAHGGK